MSDTIGRICRWSIWAGRLGRWERAAHEDFFYWFVTLWSWLCDFPHEMDGSEWFWWVFSPFRNDLQNATECFESSQKKSMQKLNLRISLIKQSHKKWKEKISRQFFLAAPNTQPMAFGQLRKGSSESSQRQCRNAVVELKQIARIISIQLSIGQLLARLPLGAVMTANLPEISMEFLKRFLLSTVCLWP